MGQHTRQPGDPADPPRRAHLGDYGADSTPATSAEPTERTQLYDLTNSERAVGAGAILLSLGVESLAWWWVNPRTGNHVSYGQLLFFFSVPTKAVGSWLAVRWFMTKDPWEGPTGRLTSRLWRIGAFFLAPLRWMDRLSERRGPFAACLVGAAVLASVVVGVVFLTGPR